MTDPVVREYVNALKDSLTYVRSIDGFLVKIGAITYDLEDKCRDQSCDPVELFRKVISADDLRGQLARFSCYRGEIYELIRSDPRHKNLRKYVDVLREVLDSIECVDTGVEVETPPATWVKERLEPRVVVEEPRRRMAGGRRFSLDLYSLVKLLLLIAVATFIITLILIMTK